MSEYAIPDNTKPYAKIMQELKTAREHIKLLEAVSKAAEKFKIYLPTTEPTGAARFSGMLIAAMELRIALKALDEVKL